MSKAVLQATALQCKELRQAPAQALARLFLGLFRVQTPTEIAPSARPAASCIAEAEGVPQFFQSSLIRRLPSPADSAMAFGESDSDVLRFGYQGCRRSCRPGNPDGRCRGPRLHPHAHAAFLARAPGGRRAGLKLTNLSGIDLSGRCLAEADLSGALLQGANLVHADLREANLFGADLTRADLTEACLEGADLRGARLERATLNGAIMVSVRAGPMPIRDHPDWPTNLTRAKLASASLSNAMLTQATLIRADLTGADLQGADLTGASLCEAVLLDADLRRARLQGTDLTDCIGMAAGPGSAAA